MLTPATTELCRIRAAEMFKVLFLYFNIQDTAYYMTLSGTTAKVKILGIHKDITTYTASYSGHYTTVGAAADVEYVQSTVLAGEAYDRSIKQICRTRRSS